MKKLNPFEFDAAPNLDPTQLINWYIEDNNYSRFLESSRNIIINGERGSGKSMTLIYHSLSYKYKRHLLAPSDVLFPGAHIGIYNPCNTPLSAKEEYKLLDKVSGIRLSETSLTSSILTNIAREFESFNDLFSSEERADLVSEFAFHLDISTEDAESLDNPFSFLRRESYRRIRSQQKRILDGNIDPEVSLDGFGTLVLPILNAIHRTKAFSDVHISLLVDDIQDLNEHQQRLINSWIAYRDHSIFSIKAAVVGLRNYSLDLTFGGTLLEGHDYIAVDLQRPIQNKESEYGKFARDVVRKRLAQVGIQKSPEEFFQVNENFVKGLDAAKQRAEKEAEKRGYSIGSKQFGDFVYKQKRAFYFRDRDSKANKPVYSGFDTLAHLSTGVIRNLLQPCFFMYEKRSGQISGKTPAMIPSDVQDEVIKEQSDKLWDFLETNLERRIPLCTSDDAKKISRLFTKIAEYFRQRLLTHESEPRVVTFVVSERDHPKWPELERLLKLSERAQILYVRDGTSKRGGGRETYYVPNRMLWPRYGLDAVGQHGRASLRVRDLWAAAESGVPIVGGDPEHEGGAQGSLFENE